MLKIKNFFKNTKGSSIIEAILLTPVICYLILFACIKAVNLVVTAKLYEHANYLTHELTTSKSAEEGLNKIAKIINSDLGEYKEAITKITLTTNMNNSNLSTMTFTIDFSFDNEESSSFKSYILANGTFNISSFIANNGELYTNFENAWKQGALIELTVERNLAKDTFGDLLNFKYYDPEKGEMTVANFMTGTELKMSSSGLIENSL